MVVTGHTPAFILDNAFPEFNKKRYGPIVSPFPLNYLWRDIIKSRKTLNVGGSKRIDPRSQDRRSISRYGNVSEDPQLLNHSLDNDTIDQNSSQPAGRLTIL